MSIYNLSKVDATNTTYEFISEVNNLSTPEQMWATMVVYVFAFIIFFITKALDLDNGYALLLASVSGAFVGVLLVFAGLIPWVNLSVMLIGAASGIILVSMRRN